MKALILFLVSLCSLNEVEAAEASQKNVILSTTTSTQDSACPMFWFRSLKNRRAIPSKPFA
jgi:hypothetical protein